MKKKFLTTKKKIMNWVAKVKKAGFNTDYVIDTHNENYLEFRTDSDIYDIINEGGMYNPDQKLGNQFDTIMKNREGEWTGGGIIRFYK